VFLVTGATSRGLDAQAVNDSAGVRVVRYARAAAPLQQWTVDTKPLLEIGGVDGLGPSEFADVRGVLRLEDGKVAVANGATNEIRIFRTNGVFLISGGRSGSGPGEFNRLRRLFRFGDTLAGVDADTRVQLFTAGGRFVRSLRSTRPHGSRNPQLVGVLHDGSTVIVATKGSQQATSDEVIYPYSVFRSVPERDSLATLFELRGYREVRVGRSPSRLLLDGEGAVTARDGRICGGNSRRFDLTCYAPSGAGVTRIIRETVARPATEFDRNVVRTAYLAANRDAPPRVREQMERTVQEFRFAAQVPAFSRVLISTSGELWVSEFNPSTGIPGPQALQAPLHSHRWSVFAPNGAWLADILLPARFVAYDVGEDYVAGVSFDADDVERVTLLRIRR
jgi:hypothetical protein